MSEINVLYTFDTRFWKLAAVSIYSLLENKKADTKCTIYCMVAPRTRGRHHIMKIIRAFDGAGLVWRTVRKSQNPFQRCDFSRWSPVIFYRLFAGRIFPNVEKILYIDSDTLIRGDLSELFQTDIKNYTMGAIQDMAPREDPNNKNGKYVSEFAKKYLENDPYFNSGVLLINCKKMDKNHELFQNHHVIQKYPDQDLLNVALKGQIKPLHPKYNYAPGVNIPNHFSRHQAAQATSNPTIIHFYSAKPYIYQHIPRNIYSLFYNTCTKINMYPEELLADELRYLKKVANKSYRAGIFRISDTKIKLLGITIAKI